MINCYPYLFADTAYMIQIACIHEKVWPINDLFEIIWRWKVMRDQSFFQLPYYIDGDIKITQSEAILRYIARKYKLCKFILNLAFISSYRTYIWFVHQSSGRLPVSGWPTWLANQSYVQLWGYPCIQLNVGTVNLHTS